MPHAEGWLLSNRLLVLTTYTVRVPETPANISGTKGGFIDASAERWVVITTPVSNMIPTATRRFRSFKIVAIWTS